MAQRSMPEYQRLLEDERNSRRSIADAIDVLCNTAGFGRDDRATIRIGRMRLPSDDIVGLVDVVFEDPRREKVYIVSLLTSARFRAVSPRASRHVLFEIDCLDGQS
jgi:hypothetical protein